MASGWQKGVVFQETRPGAGFKAGDFVEEKLRGGWGYRGTKTDVRAT